MTDDDAKLAKAEFVKEQKCWTDAERSKKNKAGGILTGIIFSRVSNPLLRTMEEVYKC